MYQNLLRSASELDDIADKLEDRGLIKEAAQVDAASNGIEKVAFMDFLKGLVAKIPGASQIKTKEQAAGMLWDAVKKIGAKKVIEAIDIALKMLSKGVPQPGMDQREAAWDDSFLRMFGYPILVIAALLLANWVGRPYLEHLKQNMQQAMQNSPQQQALDQIMQSNP